MQAAFQKRIYHNTKLRWQLTVIIQTMQESVLYWRKGLCEHVIHRGS